MSHLTAALVIYCCVGAAVAIIALIGTDGVDDNGSFDVVRLLLFFLMWPALVLWFVVWWLFSRRG